MMRILVFAKAPREGCVKTRLARDIGVSAATDLYQRLGTHVVNQLASLPMTIWFDPPEALAQMRAWLGDHEYRPQISGDLGARMSFAFAEHFRSQRSPAVAVGMDAPGVNAGVIQRAFDGFTGADVVLGPATDGGYYLVGLARMVSEVFDSVPWGSDNVLAATVRNCEAVGVAYRMLTTLPDIDTEADARALGWWPP